MSSIVFDLIVESQHDESHISIVSRLYDTLLCPAVARHRIQKRHHLPNSIINNTLLLSMNLYDVYRPSHSHIDPNHNKVPIFDGHLKPREERDYKDIYPDLDEHDQLRVFVLEDGDVNNTKNTNNDVDNTTYNTNITDNNHSTSYQPSDLKRPIFTKIDVSQGHRSYIKFPKLIIDFGFQEPNRQRKVSSETYIRPFQLPTEGSTLGDYENIDTIEKLIERKKNQVEYDMDEQDFLYLKERNENELNIIKITPEIFEILITTLENEWDKLERRMKSLASDPYDDPHKLLTLDHATSNDKYGNDDGIVPGSFYDQKCAVCNDSDCENTNAIVFCDGCDIAVHQECYGIAFIPEGQWLCRMCMINKNHPAECAFCPSKTGAFKQLDNSLWSHVICALWINELYFANPIYMEPIEGMDLIPKSRWKLTCYICKQRVGACIQCSNRNCFQAYHVTCAKRAGLYMEMSKGVQAAISNKMTLKTFCERHSPAYWDQGEVIRGIQKTRMFLRDMKILNEQNVKLRNNQMTANRLNIFKWRTENNTPIAPRMFSDVLLDIMIQQKVENQLDLPDQRNNQVKGLVMRPNRTRAEVIAELRYISDEICRYWCLKRELKRGAPLIRKNNNLLSTSSMLYSGSENNVDKGEGNETGYFISQASEVTDEVEFGKVLLKDLDRMISMSQDVYLRQLLESDRNDAEFSAMGTVYFPVNRCIEYAIIQICAKYDAQHVMRNYVPKQEVVSMSAIISRAERYGYLTVDEVNRDIDGLYEAIMKEKANRTVHRIMKKWKKEYDKVVPMLYASEEILRKKNGGELGPLTEPYLQIEGMQVGFVHVDHDLSEVEDIEVGSVDDIILKEFLEPST